MGSVFWRFILEKVGAARIGKAIGFVVAFVGFVAALEALYSRFLLDRHGREALAWSILVAASIWIIGGLAITCSMSQAKKQREIERLVEVKNNLERQILKKRRSSKKRKRK